MNEVRPISIKTNCQLETKIYIRNLSSVQKVNPVVHFAWTLQPFVTFEWAESQWKHV